MTGAGGTWVVPRLPVSVGAMIADSAGRLLVLKPTYKSGWTLPGGQMEADGETPWEACRREVEEECGLVVATARLRCVDFLRPRQDRPGGLRLLFDCGAMDAEALSRITIQQEEIADFRFSDEHEVDELLRGPVRRRVRAVRRSAAVVYLEEGHPVGAVPG